MYEAQDIIKSLNRHYPQLAQLIEKGMTVIPLDPETLDPAVDLARYEHAKPTPGELSEWFLNDRTRDPAVAILTGTCSGVVVVRVDQDNGERLLPNGQELPLTASWTAPTGTYYVLRHPGCASQMNILNG